MTITVAPRLLRRWPALMLSAFAAKSEADTVERSATVDAGDLVSRLFRDEAASLVRLARLFTDDRNAAEDLVQEAFVRLHRSAGRITQPDRAAAYLRSIVLNLARDHNRRGLMSLRHAAALLPDGAGAPMEDVVVAATDHRRVVEALRDLSPRQRDCLVLRYFSELTERETAATLGISVNSVKTHCRRGLAALGAEIGGSR